jgi:16S rRNA (adenine1518-N6/adenine1519-N6)-dimethyltransferase
VVGPPLPDRVRARALIDPADRATLRTLLSRHGLRATRSAGQHFLASPAVREAVVAAAELSSTDRVVEIGPGLGALTARLAAAAGHVLAFEIDPRLVTILRDDVLGGASNVEIVEADALAVDLLSSRPTRVVANLPYQITTPILERVLGDARRPPLCVFMVQAEVAERMRGTPRSWLSIFVASFAQVALVRRVSPGAFEPPPRVGSAIVRLVARERPLFAPYPQDAFLSLVSDTFRHRRKTLVSALGFEARLDRSRAMEAVTGAGIKSGARAETLAAADWVRLYEELARRGLRPR